MLISTLRNFPIFFRQYLFFFKIKVKEFKIPKSKFKPLLETYRESLGKLKEALKEKPIKETDSNSKHEEKDKSGKRKHVKERNTKFIKRFKQVAD